MNDNDYAVILRTRMFERRMQCQNLGVSFNEEDTLLELSLSRFLTALFTTWAKQVERANEQMCDPPSPDKPPEAPPDSASGPIPSK